MLNKRQTRYVSRGLRLKVLFGKQNKLIAPFKPMQTRVDAFLETLQLIENELPEKDLNGSGTTEAKDERKEELAVECSIICGIVMSYALATANADLEAAMGCCYSDILRMKDAELFGFVTKQYNLLKPLVGDETFAEYQITDEMLEKLLTDGKNFNDLLGRAAVADAASNVANDNINTAIDVMNGNVQQFDLLIKHFTKTAPDFVKAYLVAKKLNDAGVKHCGVGGKLTQKVNGEPLENGIVRLADTTKEKKISLRGEYEIIKVRPGDYRLEVVVDDVVVASKIVYIPRGKVVELNMAV